MTQAYILTNDRTEARDTIHDEEEGSFDILATLGTDDRIEVRLASANFVISIPELSHRGLKDLGNFFLRAAKDLHR